jgi:hypothetical protein
MSDLYAMGGRWDGVVKVRRLMEEHIVRKNRGLSSIKQANHWPSLFLQSVDLSQDSASTKFLIEL